MAKGFPVSPTYGWATRFVPGLLPISVQMRPIGRMVASMPSVYAESDTGEVDVTAVRVPQGWTVGDTIRLLRKTNGWTQTDLARVAGVAVRSILRLEGNARGYDPRHGTTSRIANAFGMAESMLLAFDPAMARAARTTRLEKFTMDMQSALASAMAAPPPGMERLQVSTNPRLVPVRHVIRALRANPEGLLLVVGGTTSDYSDELRNANRVALWASGDPNKHITSIVPGNCAAIVFTRQINHKSTDNLKRQAAKIGAVIWSNPLTPRAIHELCAEAGIITDPHQDEDVAQPTPAAADQDANSNRDAQGKTKRGVLKAFMDEHAERQPTVVGDEVIRLTKLAHSLNIPTTQMSMAQAYRLWRKAFRTEDPAPAVVTSVVPVSQVNQAQVAADQAGMPQDQEISAMVALMDEALAAVQLAKDTLVASMPHMARARAAVNEAAQLRDKLNRMQQTFNTLFNGPAAEA